MNDTIRVNNYLQDLFRAGINVPPMVLDASRRLTDQVTRAYMDKQTERSRRD